MSDLNIKELKISEALLLKNRFDVTLKRDGTLIYFKGGNLVSNRGIIRNERFFHILKILRGHNFPECIGEMYIDGGKVFDVTKNENWHKAKFMPFDLLTNDSLEEKQNKIDEWVDKISSSFITKPIRFNSVSEGWDYVLKNNEEGLVLKGRCGCFKIKVLREAKVKIKEWEKGRNKGTFILADGNRISGTSMDFVDRFLGWDRESKSVFAEIEFPFVTENGHYFQPRLRRIYCEV